MKVFSGEVAREAYISLQVARSHSKFKFCKVSVHDVIKYKKIIDIHMRWLRDTQPVGPILCLGTRNGREVDLFRLAFNSSLSFMTQVLEYKGSNAFRTRWPWLESIGRSCVERINKRSVVGVELNPEGRRRDVMCGSFDELPDNWKGKFGIVYSNSFDHCQDPVRTIAGWKSMLRPGGYLIFCYVKNQVVLESDPVGEIEFEDAAAMLGGDLVFFQDGGSCNRYSEIIVRISSEERSFKN